MSPSVPRARIRQANQAPIRPERSYVLYWMVAARRSRSSFALERAVERCIELDKPLVVLEGLRLRYPHQSVRLHRFLLDGMADDADAFARAGVRHHAYVEEERDRGKGLLESLARSACVVVTDEFPTFFIPSMQKAAGRAVDVLLEVVDGLGIVPLSAIARPHPTAHGFRRALQRAMPVELGRQPMRDPLSALPRIPPFELPKEIDARWPARSASELRSAELEEGLDLDRSVPIVDGRRGGAEAGRATLERFLRDGLPRYRERNQPDVDAESGLSPYLHFGHVGAHEVLSAIVAGQEFHPADLPAANGKREGFYPLDEERQAFVEQLLTWRELGLNYCAHRGDATRYEALPDWARETLDAHRDDPRETIYGIEELEEARTHSPIWNAAQRQLRREGTIHNYLRMVWGKKILEWSESPEQAFERAIHLNDRWALDGRDPNSYSGIGWLFGKYDRPFGPERPIYGKVRYMSLGNTRKKLRLARYLERYGE